MKSWIFYFPVRYRRVPENCAFNSASSDPSFGRARTNRITDNLTCILNLTTIGLLAVVSGFSTLGVSPESMPAIEASADMQVTQVIIEEVEPSTTKEKVESYFSDLPIMIDIARCESRFIQFNKNGSLHRGELTPADVGVMQINEKYHLKTAKKLGYDIHTLEGNMAYARYLYEKQGARPWLASSHCWAKYSDLAKI